MRRLVAVACMLSLVGLLGACEKKDQSDEADKQEEQAIAEKEKERATVSEEVDAGTAEEHRQAATDANTASSGDNQGDAVQEADQEVAVTLRVAVSSDRSETSPFDGCFGCKCRLR